jgi:hypothetical protein
VAGEEAAGMSDKGKLFNTEAEEKAYEKGYADGESSGHADWFFMIDEEFELEDEEINGPQSFLEALHKRYTVIKK